MPPIVVSITDLALQSVTVYLGPPLQVLANYRMLSDVELPGVLPAIVTKDVTGIITPSRLAAMQSWLAWLETAIKTSEGL